MAVDDADLSRVVSHALRHEPWLYELELDDEGWASIPQLLDALRRSGGAWSSLERADLERMVSAATKHRHEISGDRIRALYGHSLPGRILRQQAAPPPTLFHGTSPESWDKIRTKGLLPMGRQFVHLSREIDTARAVGLRKSAIPVILLVSAGDAASSGISFYRGNEHVWLAESVPAPFLTMGSE